MMEPENAFADADDSEVVTMSRKPRILDPIPPPGKTSVRLMEHRGGAWDTAATTESNIIIANRNCGNAEGDDHASGGPETLETVWMWTVNACTWAWDKLEPLFGDYLPEDRNPFWVCGTLFLVFLLAITGLRAGAKPNLASIVARKAAKLDNMPPISAPHVTLPDGRRVAYREQGTSQQWARHTLLIVHGFPSSRLAGIPGITSRLLEEFGVRLIAYDRPGFGESDPLSRLSLRALAQDMAHIADSLGVEEKFWVVGYSTGGIYAWAAMKYIPDRLAGVSLFAPGGNFYAPNMTKQETNEIWGALTFRQKMLYRIARWAPSFLRFYCRKMFLENISMLQNGYLFTVGKDNVLMQNNMFLKALMRDVQESLRQNNAAVVAHEFFIQVSPWGFHLSDFRIRQRMQNLGLFYWLKTFWKEEERGLEGFSSPIHIWQGTEDQIVPPSINDFAIERVPQAVLHRLNGEGHFSYFWFCDKCHRNIFLAMFKEPEGAKVRAVEDPASVGLETYYPVYEQIQTTNL